MKYFSGLNDCNYLCRGAETCQIVKESKLQ